MFERRLRQSGDRHLPKYERPELHERKPMLHARVPGMSRRKPGLHGYRLQGWPLLRDVREVSAVQSRRRLRQASLQRLLRRKRRLRDCDL